MTNPDRPIGIKTGDRYRALTDASVICLVHWSAPFTGGQQVTFPAGETATVSFDPPSHAEGVSLIPDRYRDLLPVLVPAEDAAGEKFDSYSLVVSFEELAQYFRKVP